MDNPISLPKSSGSTLKVIAILSMVIDHCAYFLMDGNTVHYDVMRCLGRVAFPVFAFLVAEGFAHTRNRKKYFGQLLAFAVASEIPWFLLNGADGTHNVMFTLALGVAALAVFEKLNKNAGLCICIILLIAWFATWSGVDYGWRGVLVIVIFYLSRASKPAFPSGRTVRFLCAFPLMMHYGIVGAMFACTVVFLYDGTRGFIRGQSWKYVFYTFYPLHLAVIKILCCRT